MAAHLAGLLLMVVLGVCRGRQVSGQNMLRARRIGDYTLAMQRLAALA